MARLPFPMKVALMGKGNLAIQIAGWFRDRHDLIVVPVQPEPTWCDSLLTWCQDNQVTTYKDLNIPKQDLIFSCFYDKILRKNFIESHGRVLNLHNSPLPKYRGVNPINWALKNGEPSHGVTIHEIDEGIDTGRILGQVSYSIYPEFEEVQDVYDKALEYGWVLFKNTIPLINKIVPTTQSENSSYYSDKDRPKLLERSSWRRTNS